MIAHASHAHSSGGNRRLHRMRPHGQARCACSKPAHVCAFALPPAAPIASPAAGAADAAPRLTCQKMQPMSNPMARATPQWSSRSDGLRRMSASVRQNITASSRPGWEAWKQGPAGGGGAPLGPKLTRGAATAGCAAAGVAASRLSWECRQMMSARFTIAASPFPAAPLLNCRGWPAAAALTLALIQCLLAARSSSSSCCGSLTTCMCARVGRAWAAAQALAHALPLLPTNTAPGLCCSLNATTPNTQFFRPTHPALPQACAQQAPRLVGRAARAPQSGAALRRAAPQTHRPRQPAGRRGPAAKTWRERAGGRRAARCAPRAPPACKRQRTAPSVGWSDAAAAVHASQTLLGPGQSITQQLSPLHRPAGPAPA